jgi:phthiocerol/phenolphthiocerol synthesis type-I polyketide synthase E
MMEPILDAFRHEVAKANPQAPQMRLVSNVTGDWMTPEQAVDPDYWAQHLRQTVRFSDCLSTLLEEPDRVFLEVGPGRTLASLTRMHSAKTSDTVVASSTRHPEEHKSDVDFFLESVAQMWTAGVRLDWHGMHAGDHRSRLPLPTYPFERQRYWLEPGNLPGYEAPTAPSSSEALLQAAPSPASFAPAIVNGHGAADPSSDQVDQIIATIWEELLGVERIGPDESFFDLGGTSLTAARMFALITQRCGPRLPLSTLVNAPTVATLADAVRNADAETPSLVQIQSGDGLTPPVFLIHAEGGHVLMYRDLARLLGTDLTVYGIQSRGLDGSSEPSDDIEEMADRYVSEIRKVQPDGPYYVGGWCLGGTIAYEMAKKLEDQGQEVAWLGMIQARHTSYWQSRDQAPTVQRLAWRVADRTSFESQSIAELEGKAKLQYITEKARRTAMRSMARVSADRPRGALVTELAAANACGRAHLDAYWSYDPGPYDGRVAFVRATNQPSGVQPDPTLGWGPLLKGEVELYEIPAFHGNIIHGERTAMVAEVLRPSIDAARDAVARADSAVDSAS